jgi:hypothetical protein
VKYHTLISIDLPWTCIQIQPESWTMLVVSQAIMSLGYQVFSEDSIPSTMYETETSRTEESPTR